MKKLQDPERMRSLGWEPKISLEDGLEKTINWFFKERDSLRL